MTGTRWPRSGPCSLPFPRGAEARPGAVTSLPARWSSSLECFSMERTTDRVLAAALPLFVAHGYAGASLEKVRRHAGVSNGSLYHHFPRRADLAARLLNAGMRQCQDAVLAVLTGAGAAEAVVRWVLREQLRWGAELPGPARWFFSALPDEVLLPAVPVLGADPRRYAVAVGDWLDAQSRAG